MFLLWVHAAATAAPLPADSAGPKCYTSVPPMLAESRFPISAAPACCSKCDPYGGYGLLLPTIYYAELKLSDGESSFMAEELQIVPNGRDDRLASHLNNALDQHMYDRLYRLFDGYQNDKWADDDYYFNDNVIIDSDYERARTNTDGDEPVMETDFDSDFNLDPRAVASGDGNNGAFNSMPSARPTVDAFEEERATQNTAPGRFAVETSEQHTETSVKAQFRCDQCVSQEQCQQLGREINAWHHTCT